MHRKYVKSSVIESIGYRQVSETLEIKFLDSGDIYQYFDVPNQVHFDLMHSISKGQYYNEYIKNYYEESKVT
ncbi:KTSC domain-containing protein [Fulvivirga ligni]|uniref:KTSC domain-containing protein n=1 Tax=Fulvivirga ligni TaxID=2904246 RepID=UPI001F473452|nr:KTSC domain-containing protein [Fulvivirga ligni]UII22193.1 KTSC domain-containing protein [Fulvivirga ligni]